MIGVNNLTASSIDKEFLKRIAQKVLKDEKVKRDLSIALIGPGKMRKLNKKYRAKNRVTDVLSFPNEDDTPVPFHPSAESLGLGEIVICPREVKKNAKKFGQSFKKELSLCLIHGILHLLGYNHETSKEKGKKMQQKQNYYLEKCQDLIL
jgi:probable rRNA maturation factor